MWIILGERDRKDLDGMRKLLLHTCCANCATYPYLSLSRSFDVTCFFYNPNIAPADEYERRLSCVMEFADIYEAKLLIGPYEQDLFEKRVKGLEKEKEGQKRCAECFRLRLEKTKDQASSGGFDLFATTLSVSPHKNAKTLNQIGKSLGDDRTAFCEADFKKHDGFRVANSISRSLGFYRQDYCGCLYSIRD